MGKGLSKSLYLKGKQCHKALWLHKYKPEFKDELTERQKAIFATGHEVGELACDLFPSGVMVPFEGLTVQGQIGMTAQAMADGQETIYEASFEYDGIFVKVDILRKDGEAWDIYEVKSATSVKPVNDDDVALQLYVLSQAGIKVGKVYLVHLNKEYTRNGEIEVEKLFSMTDLTDIAQIKQGEVQVALAEFAEVMDGSLPEVKIGRHCSEPYDCAFKGHCWQDVPENSVIELAGKGINKFDYYHRGIRILDDLPLDKLNGSQRFQVEQYLKRGEHIDPEGLSKFLDTLWYPLVHLDFETFQSPVPLFNRTKSYQQVPFQYSIHIQMEQGGPIEHCEFLAVPGVDPRPELIAGLTRDIPRDACILTYYMSFEKGRLAELGRDFPDFAEVIDDMISRVRDLIVPFKKRYAYHWQQQGSNSIKDVLPAFIPDLSYEGLKIANGGMAMTAYHQMCSEGDPEKLAEIRQDLLEYCRLDTEAMVRLLECLYCLAK